VALLARLADSPEPLPELVAYQRALLAAVGSIPRFDACMACGRGDDLTHFSSFEGGMICRHCEALQVEKREVTARTWRTLRDGVPTIEATTDGCGPAPESLRAAAIGPFSLLNYHIAHLMGREPLLASKVVTAAERRRLR
jgi:recombinational DNA repair protein (RecF pathway)